MTVSIGELHAGGDGGGGGNDIRDNCDPVNSKLLKLGNSPGAGGGGKESKLNVDLNISGGGGGSG